MENNTKKLEYIKKKYNDADTIRMQWLSQYDFIANMFYQVSGTEQKTLLPLGYPNAKKFKNYSSFGINLVEEIKKNYANMLFPQKKDLISIEVGDSKDVNISKLSVELTKFLTDSNFYYFVDYFIRDFLLGTICFGLEFDTKSFYTIPFNSYCFTTNYVGEIETLFIEKKQSDELTLIEAYDLKPEKDQTKSNGKVDLTIFKKEGMQVVKETKSVKYCPYEIIRYYPLNNENYGRGVLYQINEDYQRYNLIQKQISKLIRIMTPKYLATTNSTFDYSGLLDDDIIPVDTNQTTAPTLTMLQIDINGLNGLLSERNLLEQKIKQTCNIFIDQTSQTATNTNAVLDNLNGNLMYKLGNIQNNIAQKIGGLIINILEDNDKFLTEDKEDEYDIKELKKLKYLFNNYLTNTFDLNISSVVQTIQTIALFDPQLSLLDMTKLEKIIIDKNIGSEYISEGQQQQTEAAE